MKTMRSERLLAAALLGSVLGAAGCASTSAQSEPTTPSASAEKASCKGTNGCKGTGTPGETAAGVESSPGATGEKGSCKGQNGCNGSGTPGQTAAGVPAAE